MATDDNKIKMDTDDNAHLACTKTVLNMYSVQMTYTIVVFLGAYKELV